MQLDATEALGLLAGAIGSLAFAPQAIKILREKRAEDVSLATFAMVLTGASLWAVYGFWRGAPSLVIWNLVAVGLSGAVVIGKLRWGRRRI